MSTQHFLNGQWVEADQLVIPAFDLTVIRGYGIFELLRTYNQRLFRSEDHLDRLERSAELLDITLPVSRDEIKQLANEGIKKNNFPETTVRIIVTGGISDNFITPGKPSLMMIFTPVKAPAPEVYTDGAKVITWPNHRFMPEAKTLNYGDAVLAMKKARSEEALEALYIDPTTKEIFEGTATNVFIVKDGVLLTPPEGTLKGITRKVVMELANQLNIECHEQKLFVDDLNSAGEVLITGSSKQVVPVVQVENVTIGGGKVGPVAQKLKNAFEELAAKN